MLTQNIKRKKDKLSMSEFMTCILSRHLVDSTLGLVGGNAQVPMAACMLAQQIHAPNLTWISGGSGYVNPMPPLVISSSSYRERAEAVLPMERILGLQGKNIDFFFAGGLQFDATGKVNLVGIGDPFTQEYKVRGPGSAGISFMSQAKQLFYYTNRHTTDTFVKTLDFVSAVPSPPKNLDRINRIKKPHMIVTPLGVFNFEPPGKIKPVSRHQGVSREDIIINTGFEFEQNLLTEEIPITEPPTEEEIEILRETVDSNRILRTSF